MFQNLFYKRGIFEMASQPHSPESTAILFIIILLLVILIIPRNINLIILIQLFTVSLDMEKE